MLAENGAVIYVGKSARLRTRLLSYFRARGRRNKAARILRHAFSIEWEYTPTEFSALLLELRLIKRHRPQFNETYVADDWPRAYIAITNAPVPGIRVVPRSDHAGAQAMFGPFRRVSRVRDAVRALAELLEIRDCTFDDPALAAPRKFWFEGSTKTTGSRVSRSGARPKSPQRVAACLRHELGSCPAPCIGRGNHAKYDAAVTELREFLSGRSQRPVEMLTNAMLQASSQLEFERAALMRDRLESVTWLHERVNHFHANVDRLTFRYNARTNEGLEHVYLIRRGTVRAELPAPSNEQQHYELQVLARRIFEGPDPKGADIPLHDLDEFHLVSSWFRRHPSEQARIVPIAIP
jgi:excinuclease UvrABC nuclease subunit